ncbi:MULTISPECIES: D-alanine--D-alanine ligase [Calditerrivibrio]|uniref:D-alanine--D-alanine ligase n=1 Tax=Calditerrivibrio nitroreducens TaxID=477976 RepID=A0A2J6WHD5_9BACT|nr:MAG: D-alanine--D-alanine ligase [Calditerrivibrio nitroreducens]
MLSDKIAVLYGGLSSERDVSIKTGNGIYNALLRKGFKNSFLLDADWSLPEKLIKHKPDFCYIALHGRYGEDGTVQGLLEYMRIPYNGPGVTASAISFDKVITKKILKSANIPTADYFVYKNEQSSPFYPCVVKPAREGSTIGVTIVYEDKEFLQAIDDAKKYDNKIIVERFVKGKELTISIIDDLVLPIIWIRPKKGFYDYTSKYTKGMTEYFFETGLTPKEEEMVKKVAKDAYDVVGCEGASRVDIIYDGEIPNVLEINTLPGMTETSLLPNAAAKYGIAYDELVEMLYLKGKNRYE